jgi:glutamate decarboxylase
LAWDFGLPLVRSINVSSHKYGYVYPGVGWILWKDSTLISPDMIFELKYLGGVEKTCTLNFSRPSLDAVLQYYNFIRLGREGYTRIITSCRLSADYLARKVEEIGKFDVLSAKDGGTPLVAMKLKDVIQKYTVYDLSPKLKEDGWIVPAYTLPEGAQDISILRVVVKESFTVDMAARFIDSLKKALDMLEKTGGVADGLKDGHAIC